ncbi:MAG: protein kinase, partial [Rivularia sp. (in: cyanobacteria)]
MTNQILQERYEIQSQLGKNPGRKTLLAKDLETQELVVVKLLNFDAEFQWQDLKLFEREAQILQELSHPAIPNYLDSFKVDLPNSKGFGLVQSYIPAKSLEEHLQSGRTFSETEVKQIGKALLSVLTYLHSRQPAVIHRDIKPSNILLADRTGNHVGDVYLID